MSGEWAAQLVFDPGEKSRLQRIEETSPRLFEFDADALHVINRQSPPRIWHGGRQETLQHIRGAAMCGIGVVKKPWQQVQSGPYFMSYCIVPRMLVLFCILFLPRYRLRSVPQCLEQPEVGQRGVCCFCFRSCSFLSTWPNTCFNQMVVQAHHFSTIVERVVMWTQRSSSWFLPLGTNI